MSNGSVVSVWLFAWAREKIGKGLINVNVTVGVTLDKFLDDLFQNELKELYPKRKSFMIAVNNSYISQGGYILKPGDEISIIPPVSGGM